MSKLVIENLHVARDGVEIVHGVDFSIGAGEVHVLLGKNGSGKTTLLNALMGNPLYSITDGSMTLNDVDVTHAPTHERARKGIFLSLQQPPEIPGVPLEGFLQSAVTAISGAHPKTVAFHAELGTHLAALRLDPHFAERSVHEGASGGEKKRAEIVQMLVLSPTIALLDEPDSGLDAHALPYVADAILAQRAKGSGFLVVTHYAEFIALLKPDVVHVMQNGSIVRSGTADLLKNGITPLLQC